MYMYMYIYVHIHMFTFICTYIYIHIYIYIYTPTKRLSEEGRSYRCRMVAAPSELCVSGGWWGLGGGGVISMRRAFQTGDG